MNETPPATETTAAAPRPSRVPSLAFLLVFALGLALIALTGCSADQVRDEAGAVTLLECDPAHPIPTSARTAPDGNVLTCRSAVERREDAAMLESYRR